MWEPEIVRARFVEAADTERFLSRPLTATGAGYWPQILYTQDDRDGWDEQAQADNAQRPATRAPAGAISRHAECMDWTATRISDTMRRQLVWGYAFCRAHKREFGKLCHKRGWVKRTAYDRLHRLWDRLAADLSKDRISLREPAFEWLAHEAPTGIHIGSRMAQDVVATPAIPYTPSFQAERSADLIRSEQDAEDFASFLEERNKLCRIEQDRREDRRRRKLGLEDPVA